jgi:hypothetical protein
MLVVNQTSAINMPPPSAMAAAKMKKKKEKNIRG